MTISTVFLLVAILSMLWGVVDAILIVIALDKRGIHVNWLLFRLFFFRYLRCYKNATVSETGRIGSLYYSYVIAMNVALVCAAIGLTFRLR